jgi:CO dehydrogenase maturation factor
MSHEPFIITVTGKGGVGKTTITALLLRAFLLQKKTKILIIDADPAANLASLLGISQFTTLGEIVERTKRDVEKKSDSYDRTALLEFRLWKDALIEKEHFHFLAMGRSSGRGCYCSINDVLSYMLDNLKTFYDWILLDMDAGLEHISRNTNRTTNLTLLVTDASKMGFQTVCRIIELSRDLERSMGIFALIGNLVPDSGAHEKIQLLAEELHIPLLGILPVDNEIARLNLEGKSLFEAIMDSKAYRAVLEPLDNIFKIIR